MQSRHEGVNTVAVFVLLSLPFVLTAVSSSNSATDPYAIYDHARESWRNQQYPSVFRYRTTIDVSEGQKNEHEHFQCESFDGDIRVAGVSEEEQETPHKASGTNFKFSLTVGWNVGSGGNKATASADAHRLEASPDYLGVRLISPSYAFGLNSAKNPNDSETQARNGEDGKSLATITTVKAVDRAYNIVLVGTEALGGLYAYHLQLVPLRNPAMFRLRDLWIDVYTYQVLKLRLQGNFTNAPMKDVPWTVTFQNVGGVTFIDSETSESPLVFKHDRVFTTARITFDQIQSGSSAWSMLPNRGPSPALQEP